MFSWRRIPNTLLNTNLAVTTQDSPCYHKFMTGTEHQSPDPSELLQGPASAGQIISNADFLLQGATIEGGQLQVTPAAKEAAHAEMQQDLDSRPAPDLAPEVQRPPNPEHYLSPEERAWGEEIYRNISRLSTGQNGGPFLVGKFDDNTVPGLAPQKEYQSVVYNGDGTYHDGVYQSSDPETLFAAAIAHNLDNLKAPDLNYLLTYPSPTQKDQIVYSYISWQDVRFFHSKLLSPTDPPLSFNFEVPAGKWHTSIMAAVEQNPRALEAILNASPYGQLLRSANPEGPIIRTQAHRLQIIPIGDVSSVDQINGSRLARHVLKEVAARDEPKLPINPPVGETVKDSYRK